MARSRGIVLPTAANVPTVQVASDPGVRVPGPVQSGLRDVASGLANLGSKLQAADERINRRRESIERIRAGRDFNEFANTAFTEFSSERDLSRPEDLQAFGDTLETRAKELLENHSGTEDSRLRLAERLEPILSQFTDRAASASVKIQDTLVEGAATNLINEFAGQVRQGGDPRVLIAEGLAHLEAEQDAFRPGQEIAFKRALKARIWGAKVDDFLAKGGVDEAENILSNPEVRAAMGQAAQKSAFDRIAAVRRQGNTKLLTQEESKAKGFPGGVVVQQMGDGTFDVVFNGQGSQKTRVMTPEEVKAVGLPDGTVAQEKADGSIDVVSKAEDTQVPEVLSNKDAVKLGFSPGTLVQKRANGEFDILSEGPPGEAKILNPDQVVSLGFNKGSVVQRNENGTYTVLQQPKTGPTVTLEDDETTALGLPEGTIAQRKADGSLDIVFKPETDAGVRDQKIASLATQGVDPARAANIVDGNIRFEITTEGFAREINEIDGTVKEVPLGTTEPAPAAPVERRSTLFSLAESGAIAGIFPAGQEIFSETVGQIPGVPVAEQVIQARQEVQVAQNELVRALSINPRFPVGEIQRIRKEIKIEPSVFDSQRALLSRMTGIDRALRIRLENERRAASNTALPQDIRGNASQSAVDIENFISRLGVPQNFNESSLPPEGVPEFSKKVGVTASGGIVWETPEGERLVVE